MKGSPKFDGKVCYRKREISVNSISSKSVYFSRTFDDIIYNKRISHNVKSKLHCVKCICATSDAFRQRLRHHVYFKITVMPII